MRHCEIVSSNFSTLGLPVREQFDAYRDWASLLFEIESPDGCRDAGFAASSRAFFVGNMVMTVCDVDPLRHVRSAGRTRRDQMDHFVISMYRSGSWRFDTGVSHTYGNAREVGVIDLAQPLTIDPHKSYVHIFVPRNLMEDQIPDFSELHGCSISGSYGNLLASYFDAVSNSIPTMVSQDGADLSAATLNLVVACLKPTAANTSRARPQLDALLIHRAKRYIHAAIRCPNLSADSVAGALGVSRRTLYRAFEPLGGIQKYILGERLDSVHDALHHHGNSYKICEIAEAFGFARMDYFSRVFKNRFGYSPANVRRSPATTVPSPRRAHVAYAGLGEWLRALET